MKRLLEFLRDPLLDGMDVDGKSRLELHQVMLKKKRMLNDVFTSWHHLFRDISNQFLTGNGIEVELGAGVSPMRDSYPEVLATDIVEAPNLDRIINAEKMDLQTETVKVVYGQNCFHHFPHPDQFFKELDRVLVPGGGAILLEPYYGPFASFLYKRLFKTEGFDKNFPDWNTPATGPMNGANQALSYIIFIRDRARFEKENPSLKIVHQRFAGNYLRYLLSGGLNFRQLLPDIFSKPIGLLEKTISPFNKWISLHHIIVIKKVICD